MSEEHLNDSQCWLVASFRHDPEVANLRLPDGRPPQMPLSREQLVAWDFHANGCRYCETTVQFHTYKIRRTALLGGKPPPAAVRREQQWYDMVE